LKHILEKNHLFLESDFIFREVHKEDKNVDIWISTEGRCVNLFLDETPVFCLSRFQFPRVRWIIIRMSKEREVKTGTIHLLGDEGRNSAFLNFELQLEQVKLILRNQQDSIAFEVMKTK